MSVVVFLGPSLPLAAARRVLEADFRPPVSQGDVYRAAKAGARVIALVDGYFERVPAVWHKEILWALSHGVHVLGAASMGALRAAELAPYGMVGVGAVYEAYRDGRLEDDDEVTIVHGPAELGYPAVSEAMVNIRATLDAAEGQGVIGAAGRRRIEEMAKRLHYPQRDYGRILALAVGEGLAEAEGRAFLDWLPRGKVDRKREDALALLEVVKGLAAAPPRPAGFHFEHTDAWETLARRSGHQVAAASPDALPVEALLDELRLAGDYPQVVAAAQARVLALREADRQGLTLDRDRFRQALNGFFARRGLTRPEQIAGWMAEQQLDAGALTGFIQREMRVGAINTLFGDDALAQVPDTLRLSGRYGDLARRAEDKQRRLAARGLASPSLSDAAIAEADLLDRHFAARGLPVPDDLDAYASELGLANRFAFLQLLLRDHFFAQEGPS